MTHTLDPVLHRISMSPLGRLLGFELVDWAPERVVIRMPFRDDITTVGDLVHGGAISALADTTATAVAWSGVDPESPPRRGTTV
ncbi:MAG TPA: PaaI family thioesterase, partial [Thermoanaerobaculia bacterium]|nr:PaaI family thioesterase [Thermoanaerobaculia bacterium]